VSLTSFFDPKQPWEFGGKLKIESKGKKEGMASPFSLDSGGLGRSAATAGLALVTIIGIVVGMMTIAFRRRHRNYQPIPSDNTL
jgi:hypothetical protein